MMEVSINKITERRLMAITGISGGIWVRGINEKGYYYLCAYGNVSDRGSESLEEILESDEYLTVEPIYEGDSITLTF